jgi:HEPN domain-containing protein
MRESSLKPEPSMEGRRWLVQAENDLQFAELASREGFFAQACFNSQQAAEKALKAFLYARGAEQVMGHSVADLAAECGRLEPEFAGLKARAAPLDQFYLSTRYPNSLPGGIPAEAYGSSDAERALDMAREVIEAVKRRLR